MSPLIPKTGVELLLPTTRLLGIWTSSPNSPPEPGSPFAPCAPFGPGGPATVESAPGFPLSP